MADLHTCDADNHTEYYAILDHSAECSPTVLVAIVKQGLNFQDRIISALQEHYDQKIMIKMMFKPEIVKGRGIANLHVTTENETENTQTIELTV